METRTFYEWMEKVLRGDKVRFDESTAKEFKEWFNYWHPTTLLNETKEGNKITLSIN